MKTPRRPLLAALAGLLLAAPLLLGACRANPISRLSGSASLSITVGGAVAPSAAAARKAGPGVPARSASARVVSPASETVSVVVRDGAGNSVTTAGNLGGARSITVTGLPTGEALDVEVTTKDASGNGLSSWSGTATLAPGSNTLEALLKPSPMDVGYCNTPLPPGGKLSLGAWANFNAGKTIFYKLVLSPAAAGAYQIIYDTGAARWAWLGVYDADWKALAAVCAEPTQGWAVVDLPAGTTTINVAIANCVASPGYPAGALNGGLVARRARFYGSADTAALSSLDDGESAFLMAGDYALPGNLAFSGDQHLYGGFDAGWQSRNGTTRLQGGGADDATAADAATIAFSGPNGGGVLDDLVVLGRSITTLSASTGVCHLGSGKLVVNGCTLMGNPSNDVAAIASFASIGYYQAGSGSAEIASSALRGGVACNDSGISKTYGAWLSSGGVSIFQSLLEGGYLNGESTPYSYGIKAENSASGVVAGCAVWGGYSICTEYGGPGTATSTGIGSAVASGAGLDFFSCAVSGGHSDGGYANSYGVSIETGSNGGLITAAGCSIDAGEADGYTNFTKEAAIRHAALSMNAGNFYGCALTCSHLDGSDANDMGLFEAMAGYGVEILVGNTVFNADHGMRNSAAVYSDGFAASIAPTKNGNSSDGSRGVAQEYASFPTAPVDLPAFLGIDWRPVSSPQQLVDSGYGPSSWGIASSLFDAYPAAAFDLNGAARPYSSAWRRGACQ